jgi:hypothetical protein
MRTLAAWLLAQPVRLALGVKQAFFRSSRRRRRRLPARPTTHVLTTLEPRDMPGEVVWGVVVAGLATGAQAMVGSPVETGELAAASLNPAHDLACLHDLEHALRDEVDRITGCGLQFLLARHPYAHRVNERSTLDDRQPPTIIGLGLKLVGFLQLRSLHSALLPEP